MTIAAHELNRISLAVEKAGYVHVTNLSGLHGSISLTLSYRGEISVSGRIRTDEGLATFDYDLRRLTDTIAGALPGGAATREELDKVRERCTEQAEELKRVTTERDAARQDAEAALLERGQLWTVARVLGLRAIDIANKALEQAGVGLSDTYAAAEIRRWIAEQRRSLAEILGRLGSAAPAIAVTCETNEEVERGRGEYESDTRRQVHSVVLSVGGRRLATSCADEASQRALRDELVAVLGIS